TLTGSNAVADADIALIAGRDLTLEAATETYTETHFKDKKKSGLFSSGGFGVTIGKQQNSTDQDTTGTLAAASTVGSLGGDVTLLAGEQYRQSGSDVLAPQGDIGIAAQAVGIVEAREASRTTVEQKFKQSGLTLAITSPVVTAIQTAQQMKQAARNTESGRMKALAAATTGLAAYDAGQSIVDSASVTGGVNLVLSIGASKSGSKTTQTSDNAAVSTLSAGRDITIVASGAGEESDITLQGAQIDAARNLTLSAEDEISLRAAANTADQKSSNKNSSGSIGISIGANTGITVGASAGRGKADGEDLVYTNTHVTAGETLTLQSGGDTTLKGAVARGERVVADIGGDLLIESLQDTSRYESKQKSLGGSITVGVGVSGSVSASSSKVKSDYASVTEQTGIRAGDGGFDVQAGGDTTLMGGAITSTQQAIDEAKNRFQTGGALTLTDIENKAEYKAQGSSINLGAGKNNEGKLMPQGTSAGFGSDSDDAQSMTLAAISGVAGNQ
ncbi:MAG TPA: hemagglutinin, partial [Ochrobactrum intermedium]